MASAPPHHRRIDAPNHGRRLDAYVRQACPEVSLATLMKWIRTGAIRVNGKKAKGAQRLVEGDELTIPAGAAAELAPPEKKKRRKPVELAVVYEDDDLLVLDKPAGLAAHAGTGHEADSLAARVVRYLGAEDAPPGHRPGLAQRLDAGVSGLIPAGKHAAALRALAAAVEGDTLEKTYRAFVAGRVEYDRGFIDVPLRIDDVPRGDQPRAHPDRRHGLEAYTEYIIVERFDDASLLDLRIHTGRTHQIRAHLRWLGHALLGDARYGDAARNQRLRETHGLSRPALHARRLGFAHPTTGEPLVFESPLPPDLERLLSALRRPRRAPL